MKAFVRLKRKVGVHMSSAISILIATVVTIPFIGWYLIYIITVKIMKKRAKAVRIASDSSTILFIAAVNFILLELWGRSLLWVIFLVIFLIAFLFTLVHWKVDGDIHIKRLMTGIWRTNFIVFILAYVCFCAYGLFTRIFQFTGY